MESVLYEITSHIEGKNAKVRVYADRIEWERGKPISGAKVTAAVLTAGMSAAVTGGLRTRKGTGTEVIPMRSITSVTTKRDTMINDVVSIITAGNTIDMRCSKAEAAKLKELIMAGINGQLAASAVGEGSMSAGPVPPPPPPPPPAATPAGWYADPQGVARLRYWDGMTWTEHTAP